MKYIKMYSIIATARIMFGWTNNVRTVCRENIKKEDLFYELNRWNGRKFDIPVTCRNSSPCVKFIEEHSFYYQTIIFMSLVCGKWFVP